MMTAQVPDEESIVFVRFACRSARAAVLALLVGGCGAEVTTRAGEFGSGDGDAGLPGDDGAVAEGDLAQPNNGGVCDNPLDLTGCGCPMIGETRACYTGPAATQGKGICRDGTQSCVKMGEFAAWGPCAGSVTPGAEVCADKLDHNCNGLLGCDDPECAGMLGCCMPGTMRKCYSGPMGTD